jgi:hypothetical protein
MLSARIAIEKRATSLLTSTQTFTIYDYLFLLGSPALPSSLAGFAFFWYDATPPKKAPHPQNHPFADTREWVFSPMRSFCYNDLKKKSPYNWGARGG